MRQVSSSYSSTLSCHLLACYISSCLHVHCIIMFSKLASVPVSSFSPLSVLSPDTIACARGMSEILFYKWPRKCSQNGLKVGMWCCYVVSRSPAKFHRIWSPFDVPTDKYSGIVAGLTSDVFGLWKQLPGCTPLLSSQPNLSSQPTSPPI